MDVKSDDVVKSQIKSEKVMSADVCVIIILEGSGCPVGAQLSVMMFYLLLQFNLSEMFYDESTYFHSPGGYTFLGSTRSLPPFPVGFNSFQVRGVFRALFWECFLKLFSY